MENNNNDLNYILSLIKSNDEIINNLERKEYFYEKEKEEIPEYIQNEYSGYNIRGNSIFDAWFQVLNHVYKYGYPNGLCSYLHEYHSIHWNFPVENISEMIKKYQTIISQAEIQNIIGLSEQMLKDYSKTMNENIRVDNSAYTYGERLDIFKERILNALKKDINSRHAFGTTIKYDKIDNQPPCLVYIQLLYDNMNNKMNLYATFRSHDIFRAGFLNAYGLSDMLLYYCKELNIGVGRVEITSISAHIYNTNLNDAKLLIDCVTNNMNKEIHYDPRGNCIITKKDGNFIVELRDMKENKLIWNLEGNAKDIYKKILNDKLIIDIEHLEYIFEQLFIY